MAVVGIRGQPRRLLVYFVSTIRPPNNPCTSRKNILMTMRALPIDGWPTDRAMRRHHRRQELGGDLRGRTLNHSPDSLQGASDLCTLNSKALASPVTIIAE
jgi:hypothetical protein